MIRHVPKSLSQIRLMGMMHAGLMQWNAVNVLRSFGGRLAAPQRVVASAAFLPTRLEKVAGSSQAEPRMQCVELPPPVTSILCLTLD